MDTISRPLIALLVASLAILALWMVALRPGGSSSTAGSASGGQYSSAISAAHRAVGTANRAAPAAGGESSGTSRAASAGVKSASSPATVVNRAIKPAHALSEKPLAAQAAGVGLEREVVQAMQARRVIAVLFYNPSAADDLAVRQEVMSIPSPGGQVLKLAVPIAEVGQLPVIATQVAISSTPTVVIVDRRQRASTIVGFADRLELDQRVQDALAAAA